MKRFWKWIISAIKKYTFCSYSRIRSIRTKLEEKYTALYIKICWLNRKKVVFDNFFGKGFGDNPKYIAEEILRQGLKWDLVWLVNDISISLPKGVRAVKYGSFKAMREMASAKFFVDNIRNSTRPPKKEGQVYLQTWHGGLGFKRVEKAVEDSLNRQYVEAAQEDGRRCDAIVSCSRFQTEEYQQFFWLNETTEILEVGLPRNDGLFDLENIQEKNLAVRRKYGILEDTKIVLYMPTFRDDGSTEGYALDFDGIIYAMEQRFGEKFVFIIRMHPNVQNHSKIVRYTEKIFNGTEYPDVQELYMAADYLITDYSSVAFDFSLLRRPVFLCVLDYKEYMSKRGLNVLFDTCPFPCAYSNTELLKHITNFVSSDYWAKFEEFEEHWKMFDCGNAAKQIVDWMKEKCKK